MFKPSQFHLLNLWEGNSFRHFLDGTFVTENCPWAKKTSKWFAWAWLLVVLTKTFANGKFSFAKAELYSLWATQIKLVNKGSDEDVTIKMRASW